MATRRSNKTPSASAAVDRITTLPLELRGRIVSFLRYRQVVQLSVLSRSWRHIHNHVPVVVLDLEEFIGFGGQLFYDHLFSGMVDDCDLLGLRVALARRAQEGAASKVETLRLAYRVGDQRVKRHADRILALVNAPQICLDVYWGSVDPIDKGGPWTVDLPPAARDLDIVSRFGLMPTIAGPGAAVLRELYLNEVMLGEWPRLPSLRSLTLNTVTVKVPFAPGASCPMLEHLAIWFTTIEHACVDIRLPLLKSLDMDKVDISPPMLSKGPLAVVTIDAPELQTLAVDWDRGFNGEYKLFTLRAPRLRCLWWSGQFAEHVSIDVGRPASVSQGTIEFRSNGDADGFDFFLHEMKDYRAQMMRMLEGLLPVLSPEHVADVARPYISVEAYAVEDDSDGETIPEERLICDLTGLMSLPECQNISPR